MKLLCLRARTVCPLLYLRRPWSRPTGIRIDARGIVTAVPSGAALSGLRIGEHFGEIAGLEPFCRTHRSPCGWLLDSGEDYHIVLRATGDGLGLYHGVSANARNPHSFKSTSYDEVHLWIAEKRARRLTDFPSLCDAKTAAAWIQRLYLRSAVRAEALWSEEIGGFGVVFVDAHGRRRGIATSVKDGLALGRTFR